MTKTGEETSRRTIPMEKRKISTTTKSHMRLLVGSIFVIILLINLVQIDRSVEAKKVKKEKILKSLLKGLLLKNLSVKKNFLPLPVPIPGKWQQLISKIISDEDDKTHRLGGFSAGSSGVLLDLASSLISSKANNNEKFNGKNNNHDKANFFSLITLKNDQIDRNSRFDVDRMKKVSRVLTAKFANKLFMSNHINQPSKSGLLLSLIGTNSGSSDLEKKFKDSINLIGKRHSSPIVFAYNMAKFFKQLGELDTAKLVKTLSKKSLKIIDTQNLAPYLSMNINNKKTLLNKINYIHSLATSDGHHRSRNYRY